MKIVAVLTALAGIRRILKHLGLPTGAPQLHPARSPPQMEFEEPPAEPDDFTPAPPYTDW